MRVNSINNNTINNSKQTFKGYSNPGFYAQRSQICSAEEADRFVSAMKEANRQDATKVNFMTAFARKIVIAGEILGFRSLKQAGDIMQTSEHKNLVKKVDSAVESMIDATGNKAENINAVA